MQLEDELGKPLFIRGKRKIELTDEGVLLRRRAEEILSLVNKTEQEITQSEEEMVGQIMIGTGIFSSSQTVLSQVIEEFHDEYPLVKLIDSKKSSCLYSNRKLYISYLYTH